MRAGERHGAGEGHGVHLLWAPRSGWVCQPRTAVVHGSTRRRKHGRVPRASGRSRNASRPLKCTVGRPTPARTCLSLPHRSRTCMVNVPRNLAAYTHRGFDLADPSAATPPQRHEGHTDANASVCPSCRCGASVPVRAAASTPAAAACCLKAPSVRWASAARGWAPAAQGWAPARPRWSLSPMLAATAATLRPSYNASLLLAWCPMVALWTPSSRRVVHRADADRLRRAPVRGCERQRGRLGASAGHRWSPRMVTAAPGCPVSTS